MARRSGKLPEIVYVEHDGDDYYLLASEDIDTIEHGTIVGVYRHDSTLRMNATRQLDEV